MHIFDNIVLAFEIVFYFFHLSLLIVLIVESKTKFIGAFNNMLRMLFMFDILCFCSTFVSRIANYELWNDIFKNNTYIATVVIQLGTYFMSLQFTIHGFLAFNRFTLFWFPQKHKKFWSIQWYTFIILIIPLIVNSPRITEKATYMFLDNGHMIFIFENPETMNSALISALICSIIITIVSAIFNLLAIIKHYFYKKNSVTSAAIVSINEIAYLNVSCIIFIVHSFACLILMGRTFFADSEFYVTVFEISWPIGNDLLAMSGSISLIYLCKHSRKAYIQFYKNLWDSNQIFIKIPSISHTVI